MTQLCMTIPQIFNRTLRLQKITRALGVLYAENARARPGIKALQAETSAMIKALIVLFVPTSRQCAKNAWTAFVIRLSRAFDLADTLFEHPSAGELEIMVSLKLTLTRIARFVYGYARLKRMAG